VFFTNLICVVCWYLHFSVKQCFYVKLVFQHVTHLNSPAPLGQWILQHTYSLSATVFHPLHTVLMRDLSYSNISKGVFLLHSIKKFPNCILCNLLSLLAASCIKSDWWFMIMPTWKCPFMVLSKGHKCIGHYGWKLALPDNFFFFFVNHLYLIFKSVKLDHRHNLYIRCSVLYKECLHMF